LHTYLIDRRLRLIAGIRRDNIKINQTYYHKDTTSADPFALTAPTYSNSTASATTPMIGASFSPFRNHRGFAVFANYSESLVANEIVNPDGSGLPPERGEGLEVGVKLEFNDKLSLTLSWFTIDRTNLARGIPNTVPQAWEASGLQRSRGVDLDFFYAINPNWQVIASAASTDARYVNDGNASLIGTRIGGVPATSWSVWSKYNFATGPLKGFSFGGGVISRTSTQVYGAGYPGLVAPGFTRFDLLFGYTTKFNGRDLEYSLEVNNVFDEVYLDGVNGWGQPLSYEASVTMKF
jgi:iron complex outermembrane receptor protein